MSQGLRVRVRVSAQEREVLEDVIKRRGSPQGLVTRAKVVLMSSQRQVYGAIADGLGIGTRVITRWTHRWEADQEAGVPVLARLVDLPRSGRPSEITPEQLCKLVALACESPEDHGLPITHWSKLSCPDFDPLINKSLHLIERNGCIPISGVCVIACVHHTHQQLATLGIQ